MLSTDDVLDIVTGDVDIVTDDVLDILSSCSDSYLLFEWAVTSKALKSYDSKHKVSKKAKKMFADTISSIADEVMEYVLEKKRCTDKKPCIFITSDDIYEAFSYLNEYIIDGVVYQPLSLTRILAKYRKRYKFGMSVDAKMVFAWTLTSSMLNIAMHIHLNCHNATVQLDDVQHITDPIVFRRSYTQKQCKSRSVHAFRRVRKSNGRFE